MERNVKHLLLRKTDVLKTSIFSDRIFGGTFILALTSSGVFRQQNHVSDFFKIILFGK